MRHEILLKHEFVDYIPNDLKDGTIYISIAFATAAHNCVCGCGSEVITPLSPTDWQMTFDGQSISLYPSIGNWNFPCKSHYWIKRNRVQWASRWSREEINAARARDNLSKRRYFDNAENPTARDSILELDAQGKSKPMHHLWRDLKMGIRHIFWG